MSNNLKFYIDGAWVEPHSAERADVINPTTEAPFTQIAMGDTDDVDAAVAAARRAFSSFSRTSVKERIELLEAVIAEFQKRSEDLAQAIMMEVGAPITLSRTAQVGAGLAHLQKMVSVLQTFRFEEPKGTSLIVKEAIGVVGLITPWNWPLNQIAGKVAPGLGAGCTMVLKPSEVAPVNGIIFAEIMHDAGVPKGVFNLVNGDGPKVGYALSVHRDVDMISFTGSTRAGVLVAKAAADTVKRVHQELGGKSANILLPDADFNEAVSKGVASCFRNSGQSCNAPTRMFVPRDRHDEVLEIAKSAAETVNVGPASAADVTMGPVISKLQFDKIQALIQSGIDEGAILVVGGTDRPAELNQGYFVQPTIFGNVRPDMRIAQEEIFGPVLSILTYESIDEVVDEANNTLYGLAAYVQGKNMTVTRDVAARMRSGNVHINYPAWDAGIPFGGYKQSGNGREYAEYGLEDFLETKGILGYSAA